MQPGALLKLQPKHVIASAASSTPVLSRGTQY